LLKEHEEKLLEMPFEKILSQINVMPIKFVFGEEESEESLKKFDKQMDIKMRSFLLERLKKEFEDSL
jgi:hypothetical protein